jgi:hypothetical protein
VGKIVRAASAEFTPVDKNPPSGLVEAGSKRQNVLGCIALCPKKEQFV